MLLYARTWFELKGTAPAVRRLGADARGRRAAAQGLLEETAVVTVSVVTSLRTHADHADTFARLTVERVASQRLRAEVVHAALLRDTAERRAFEVHETFHSEGGLDAWRNDGVYRAWEDSVAPFVQARAERRVEMVGGAISDRAPTPAAPCDLSFQPDLAGLMAAVEALGATPKSAAFDLPQTLPQTGIGERATLDALAPVVLGAARRLGNIDAFAHMDPPTPWIAWATTLWNASANQNLLHPDTAPLARDIESRVVDWLAPAFGMDGGHMTSGSTISNLTALWAARELRGVNRVLASKAAHLSVEKSARLLGLDFQAIDTDDEGRLQAARLPDDLTGAALVLTAGTTSTGAVDDLTLAGRAAWTHVDAAWAGPLRFSERYSGILDGIDLADSLAVSAHEWLFQPKEAALVLFKDTAQANAAIGFAGAYLTVPNIGVLGSHGAVAVPLVATLLAWGREGLALRLERSKKIADALHARLKAHSDIEVFGPQRTGVVLWRPKAGPEVADVRAAMPEGSVSVTTIGGRQWLRHVAANPNADIEAVWAAILAALSR